MSNEPPPLPNDRHDSPSSGAPNLGLIVAAIVAVIVILGVAGYFGTTSLKENLSRARQVERRGGPPQMQAGFKQLLSAVDSVLDEPLSGDTIGKLDERGSDYFINESRKFFEQENFQELNAYLSSAYKEKLMTKRGFFIYQLMIEELSSMDGLDGWVAGTGGSHAHIASGLAETHLAWLARGNGSAYTVTAAGQLGFDEHLVNATDHYYKAVESDEHNSVAIELLLKIGLGLGHLDEMIPQLIESGLEHTPEDGWLTNRIVYYLTPRWHGSRPEMIAFIQDDLKKWPDSGGKFSSMISSISWATDWGNAKYLSSSPEAMEVYKKIITRYTGQWPEGAYATEAIASLLIRKKNYNEAIMLCKKRLITIPQDAKLHSMLGRAYYYKKEHSKASDLLVKALDLGASDALSYYYLCRSATQGGDFKTGEMAAVKAAEMLTLSDRWKKASSYAQLAKCTWMRADYEAALKAATQAVEIDPNQGYSWYIRGKANYKLQKLKDAKADFLKSIELEPRGELPIDRECPGWREW